MLSAGHLMATILLSFISVPLKTPALPVSLQTEDADSMANVFLPASFMKNISAQSLINRLMSATAVQIAANVL